MFKKIVIREAVTAGAEEYKLYQWLLNGVLSKDTPSHLQKPHKDENLTVQITPKDRGMGT